ncbi:MAG: DUF4062 domain-containing protein [Anaerolineaceae bacterium]
MQKKNSRQIRVFISSTFRDMQRERDYLIKFTFPQLRELCEQRGVIWSEVDLRWGITSEQSAEDQVLPICFHEIDHCRSYFIGILGERYGWIPDKIEDSLLERQPWIREHTNASVTELEICHGALNDPIRAENAFFYFRDPHYIETVPTEEQKEYSEMPWRGEVERFGMEEAQRRVEQRKEKLTDLKDMIRKSNLSLRENFNSPQQLGEWIQSDLTAIINTLYPEGSQLTGLQQENREQEAFAASRTRVYVGGEKYFQQIEEHLDQKHTPLALVGEAGIGKSTLLANWGLHYRREHADVKVIMHFIGASTIAGNWAAMLRRIMRELQEQFNLQGEIPEDTNSLREAFPDWLFKASQKGKIVLILDALNQLEDKQGAQELTWLPQEFPENVQIIVSTLPGKTFDVVKERGFSNLAVEPLTQNEREQFAKMFLGQYSKQLNSQQLKKIVDNTKTSNPLALRILLDELRQFGSYEQLDEIIQRFLDADSIIEMLELVFERCENDFEAERPDLVKDTLCSIWAARQGLSEAELLDVLGNEEGPLAQGIWSPLHLALGESLVEHSGFINFSHDYLRQAVEKHYLATESEKRNAHIHLANYFQNMDGYPKRKVNELPWQLQQGKEWKRLYDQLADPDYFLVQWPLNRNDLYAYWVVLEENSNFNRVQAYEGVLEKSKDPIYLLLSSEHLSLLNGISLFFKNTGYLEEAMHFLKEQERICREMGNKEDLQISLGNQALILRERGRSEEAFELFKELEDSYRESGNQYGLQLSLGNQALILHSQGKLEEAMELQKEKERICRELGDKNGLQTSLSNQALILKAWGRWDEAMELWKNQERMCRELGDQNGMQTSLGNQALILQLRGGFDEAMKLHQEEERICRKLGNKDSLQRSLGNQALILQGWGRLEEAMNLFKEQERMCGELGKKEDLQNALGNQALILKAWGRLDESMELLKAQEKTYRELGNQDGLQRSLGNQALILQAWGKLDEAMQMQQEKERICRELGNKDGIQTAMGNQALILKAKGKLEDAMSLFKEQEQICRELGNKNAIQTSLGNQGLILNIWGRREEAMQLQKEKERICRELGDLDGIQTALGNQVVIMQAERKFDEGLRLLSEKEQICIQIKNIEGLCTTWVYQGSIHLMSGHKEMGLSLLRKAYEQACQNKYSAMAAKIKVMLDKFS